MKLGSPVLITSHPLTAPSATATAKAHRMDSHIGQPHWTDRIAITTPAKPIMEPTERSNSPAIISRQAPTAMIANWAETTPQFIAPLGREHPGVGCDQQEEDEDQNGAADGPQLGAHQRLAQRGTSP